MTGRASCPLPSFPTSRLGEMTITAKDETDSRTAFGTHSRRIPSQVIFADDTVPAITIAGWKEPRKHAVNEGGYDDCKEVEQNDCVSRSNGEPERQEQRSTTRERYSRRD